MVVLILREGYLKRIVVSCQAQIVSRASKSDMRQPNRLKVSWELLYISTNSFLSSGKPLPLLPLGFAITSLIIICWIRKG